MLVKVSRTAGTPRIHLLLLTLLSLLLLRLLLLLFCSSSCPERSKRGQNGLIIFNNYLKTLDRQREKENCLIDKLAVNDGQINKKLSTLRTSRGQIELSANLFYLNQKGSITQGLITATHLLLISF